MPRMSIYLPDELAEQLKSVDAGGSASQVIQEALRRFLGETAGPPAYACPPPNASQLLEQVKEQLMPRAQEEYERGYTAALNRAPKLPWSSLDELARTQFQLEKWLEGHRSGALDIAAGKAPDGAQIPSWLQPLAEDLGELADPIGFDRSSFRPTEIYLRGYSAAMRDAYNAVVRSQVETGDSSATPSDVTPETPDDQ